MIGSAVAVEGLEVVLGSTPNALPGDTVETIPAPTVTGPGAPPPALPQTWLAPKLPLHWPCAGIRVASNSQRVSADFFIRSLVVGHGWNVGCARCLLKPRDVLNVLAGTGRLALSFPSRE